MNKVLAAILILGSMSSLIAEMRFNPLNNCYYSYPETPDIDQEEYSRLLDDCAIIEKRIQVASGGIIPSAQLIMNQWIAYLVSVGTSTANRLIVDIKKNALYLPNGVFMRNICY